MPAAGAWLTADLRAAATELSRRASGPESLAYRALLNRAVILSALGDHRTAIAVSDRALEMARPSLRRRTWFGPACCIAPVTSSVPSMKSTLSVLERKEAHHGLA